MTYRTTSRHSSPPRERGAALVVALLVFALCAAIIVAMKSEFNRFFTRSANILLHEQAQAYLRGAEELATLVLVADYDADAETEQPRDDLTEQWAQEAQPFALDEGGWLTGRLEDLQGRFNLNTLLPKLPKDNERIEHTPAQEQFIRLLQALEDPIVAQHEAILITESIGDWIDDDQNPLSNGAEDDYYYSLEPSYRAGNRALSSVSELRSVAYMTPQIYAALAPWVTVWPMANASESKLNFHTAGIPVLRSLNQNGVLNPLLMSEAESLFDHRKETGFADLNDFMSHSVFTDRPGEWTDVKGLLGEESNYFLLTADVELADRNMRLYSVLEQNKRVIKSRVRASGSL